jgi:hypothetical protein
MSARVLTRSGAVDSRGTRRERAGTPVDDTAMDAPAVDEQARRPRSVLTLIMPLTCDDGRRPQFPQALLLPRVLSFEGQSFIESVDDERKWVP